MSKPISLFSGYSQAENRTTNYCLLALKMIYDESPRFLGEVLGDLVGTDMSDRVGVTFRQQEKRIVSVPDGLIMQAPVTVYIETKHFDWFHDDQLEAHLEELAKEAPGLNILLALSKFDGDTDVRFDRIRGITEKQYKGRLAFSAVSFEDFLSAVEGVGGVSPAVRDAIADLRLYFDEEGLLPSWQVTLDVVNCAGTPEEVLDGGVYMCPATAGSYNHQRCKYFGMYRNKTVEVVALIDAVVEVELGKHERIQWNNGVRDQDELKTLARQKLAEWRPGADPSRVFILGPQFATDFRKDSRGGLLGSKRYFNVSELKPSGADELAAKLSGRCSSEFER